MKKEEEEEKHQDDQEELQREHQEKRRSMEVGGEDERGGEEAEEEKVQEKQKQRNGGAAGGGVCRSRQQPAAPPTLNWDATSSCHCRSKPFTRETLGSRPPPARLSARLSARPPLRGSPACMSHALTNPAAAAAAAQADGCAGERAELNPERRDSQRAGDSCTQTDVRADQSGRRCVCERPNLSLA